MHKFALSIGLVIEFVANWYFYCASVYTPSRQTSGLF